MKSVKKSKIDTYCSTPCKISDEEKKLPKKSFVYEPYNVDTPVREEEDILITYIFDKGLSDT